MFEKWIKNHFHTWWRKHKIFTDKIQAFSRSAQHMSAGNRNPDAILSDEDSKNVSNCAGTCWSKPSFDERKTYNFDENGASIEVKM